MFPIICYEFRPGFKNDIKRNNVNVSWLNKPFIRFYRKQTHKEKYQILHTEQKRFSDDFHKHEKHFIQQPQ